MGNRRLPRLWLPFSLYYCSPNEYALFCTHSDIPRHLHVVYPPQSYDIADTTYSHDTSILWHVREDRVCTNMGSVYSSEGTCNCLCVCPTLTNVHLTAGYLATWSRRDHYHFIPGHNAILEILSTNSRSPPPIAYAYPAPTHLTRNPESMLHNRHNSNHRRRRTTLVLLPHPRKALHVRGFGAKKPQAHYKRSLSNREVRVFELKGCGHDSGKTTQASILHRNDDDVCWDIHLANRTGLLDTTKWDVGERWRAASSHCCYVVDTRTLSVCSSNVTHIPFRSC